MGMVGSGHLGYLAAEFPASFMRIANVVVGAGLPLAPVILAVTVEAPPNPAGHEVHGWPCGRMPPVFHRAFGRLDQRVAPTELAQPGAIVDQLAQDILARYRQGLQAIGGSVPTP